MRGRRIGYAKGVARRREQQQITLTNCREKAIFAAPLSGRQAMKQFIVINTETANKSRVGSGGSLAAPPCLGCLCSLPFPGVSGRTMAGSHRPVFCWFSMTNRKALLPDLSSRLLGGRYVFGGWRRRDRPARAAIAILPTVTLISAHARGRLHVQVHRVMGRVEL